MTRSTLRKSALLSLLALATFCWLSDAAHAQTTIDTFPDPANYNFAGVAGIYYGQTFTAPNATDTVLTSFAAALFNTNPQILSIYVYDTTTTRVVGSALFTSAPTGNTTVEGRNAFLFNTGKLQLTTGLEYAALFTDNSTSHYGPITFAEGTDPYAGGSFINAYPDITGPYSSSDYADNHTDLLFRATFTPAVTASAVPEPSEYAAAGVFGATLLFAMARVQRKAKSANRTTTA